MNQRALSRRRFLKAAGGIVVALPILSSLRVRAQETVFPKRLILVFNPNGTIQDEFWPTNILSESVFNLGPILAPLERHRDKLLLLKGLTIRVASMGPGGPHQKGVGGLFTGRELLEGEFVDGCGSRAGWANGISVDQEVALRLGGGTLLPSLELGVRAMETDVQSRISYAGPAQPLPPMNEPYQVYQRLFSGLTADPSAFDALRVQRRSVLDTVQEQFTALDSRLGTEDRDKLARHLELVRDIERRLDLVIGNGRTCGIPLEPAQLDADNEETMQEIARLQVDLLAAALTCDLTRVGSLQFSNALNRIRFPWLDSLREGHALSHAGPTDTEARTQLVGRGQWYAEQVARLLDQLAAVPEGEGTALDNTLLVWGNEIGIGQTHTHENIPFLLAGSAGGVLRTGRFLQFGGQSHSDLLVTILNAMGIETNTFGNPDFVTGPLAGLT